MAKARWNVKEKAPDTAVPASTRVLAIASGKGGVGKSSVTVNLAAALAAKGFAVGVLDADIWGFSVPRMLGIEGRLAGATTGERKIAPNVKPLGQGRLKVVSMGLLVDDEGDALMWRGLMLNRGGAALPRGRRLGRPRLPAHRHAAGHRRRADGPGPHAAADRDDHRDHSRGQRPEGGHPGRGHGHARATSASWAWWRT